MTRASVGLGGTLDSYLREMTTEHEVLRELREVTAPLELSQMQIGINQGAFMSWLVRLIGARHTIEVGVFTGYSALWTALALPEDGSILGCDVSQEWTDIAKEHFRKAGVGHKLELVLAPAAETLAARLQAGEASSYDFAFIDADKENYPTYYESCLRLLRRGGVIVFDNALWGGSVADPTDQKASTRALRAVNRLVIQDRRVDASLVPVGDGLLLARKL